MSEEKFTKGEWRLLGYEIKVKVDFGDGWFPICKVNVFSEAKANAALIAAAPEMYEMLKTACGMFSGTEFASRAESLLAKARGE